MKLNKVLSIVALALVVLFTVSNFVCAMDPGLISGVTTSGASKVKSIGQKVVGIVQTVGSVAAVVVLVVLGIKYMMGSTEEKAEYKKTLLPYVIGAVLIFAASNLASVVYHAATGI